MACQRWSLPWAPTRYVLMFVLCCASQRVTSALCRHQRVNTLSAVSSCCCCHTTHHTAQGNRVTNLLDGLSALTAHNIEVWWLLTLLPWVVTSHTHNSLLPRHTQQRQQ